MCQSVTEFCTRCGKPRRMLRQGLKTSGLLGVRGCFQSVSLMQWPAIRGLAVARSVSLSTIQWCSRIKKENGVFCIMAVARRSEAFNTLALNASLSPDLTIDVQNRMW